MENSCANLFFNIVTQPYIQFLKMGAIQSQNEAFPELITSQYEIGQILGKGAFGAVYLVLQKDGGKLFALKVVDRKDSEQEPMSKEGKLMMKLRHPNIVSLHNHVTSVSRGKHYIVMDYMKGGSLRKRLEERGNLNETQSKLYFYQMCKAVKYLHDNNVAHRDLKPDNMLLASDRSETLLKISDFGISNNCTNYLYSLVGTKVYVAPEVILGRKYGKKVDVWSLGIVLFECLSGDFPFPTEANILQGEYKFKPNKWNSISDSVKDLIKSILKVVPAERCNITDLLETTWIKENNVPKMVNELRQKYA